MSNQKNLFTIHSPDAPGRRFLTFEPLKPDVLYIYFVLVLKNLYLMSVFLL